MSVELFIILRVFCMSLKLCPHTKGRTWIEGLGEQAAKENI
jgi:hypothetical protein